MMYLPYRSMLSLLVAPKFVWTRNGTPRRFGCASGRGGSRTFSCTIDSLGLAIFSIVLNKSLIFIPMFSRAAFY